MDRESPSGIAIIGMAGRFPQAPDLARFWSNLRDGVESVSYFTDSELENAGVVPAAFRNPRYVKARAVLENVELFDADFFGFSPKEAEFTDPQIRIFLECCWEALESAGWDPFRYPGMVGVFAGMSISSYIWQLAAGEVEGDAVSAFRTLIGGAEKDHLATTVSYRLNLRGPSFNVQTACSTSLSAVHLACRSLMTFDCDMALAGGSSVAVPQRSGYMYEPGGILSADGHCRTFDAMASGSVSGDGAGVVLLKRLEEAITDGDTIYAVIKGSAVNNDGRRKVGFTAPAVEGQAEAIALAMAAADVDCASVGYVEAHGSATALGDPIEIAALEQVYSQAHLPPGSIPVGSVKTNIGHLGAAAGVAGLLKTVLAIHYGQIPPSLNFSKPNPNIPFHRSSFRVNDVLRSWPKNDRPRRAGVSSFGIGGTNAHLIIEQAPERTPAEPAKPWQLMVLSARSAAALERATDRLTEHLQANPNENAADLAFTLQEGRKAFQYRRIAVCRDLSMAAEHLRTRAPSQISTALSPSVRRPVAFLFPGLGDQYLDMGRGLYESEPGFARDIDLCCEFLKPHLGVDLRSIMYPNPRVRQQGALRGEGLLSFRDLVRRTQEEPLQPKELHRTVWAQPALFVTEYALARLWMSWGIIPDSMLGYSIGEYVAACLAGVISLEDSLRLVAERARRIEELALGAMLAIAASEERVRPLLSRGVSISGINGPSLCVISGEQAAVDALEQRINKEGELICRRLRSGHAFHSPLMEPVATALTAMARPIHLNAPQIPYISNVSGDWITAREAKDPAYWALHLCRPVQFAAGLQNLCSTSIPVFIEVGPGQMLSSLAEQYLNARGVADRVTLPSMPHSSDWQPDRAFVLQTLGQLWLAGIEPDWAGVHAHERRVRVNLPTYPFERKPYWLTPTRRIRVETSIETSDNTATLSSNVRGPDGEEATLRVEESSNSAAAAVYVGPTNSTEQKIVQIWEDLLGVDHIGVHDEFLRLGGNSLLAIRVAAELREAFQIEFPLQALLSAATVAEVALFVEDALLTMIESMDEVASRTENQ